MDFNTSLNLTGYYYLMPRFAVLFYLNPLLLLYFLLLVFFFFLDKNDCRLEVYTIVFTLLFLSLMATIVSKCYSTESKRESVHFTE